jgi:hypothetical protein
MPHDFLFNALGFELRGGPLDGARYESGPVTMCDDPESSPLNSEFWICRLKNKDGETLGHRYDFTDEYTPNDFRVYRYAGVVSLPTT